jgi:uncharacterized protein (TIGR00369 family)
LYPIYGVVRPAQARCGIAMQTPAMSVEQLEEFLRREFFQFFHPQSGLTIEHAVHCGARVRQSYSAQFLRPGGTISGPTMMALADFTMYVAVLATVGTVPLAVTTNLNINFLRRPADRDLVAACRLLKVGKSLVVGEVIIHSDGSSVPVAHATSTYSIPRGK